jgi:hypothetical protein
MPSSLRAVEGSIDGAGLAPRAPPMEDVVAEGGLEGVDRTRADWQKAVVLALPFAIALTNTTWLGNGIGDVDVWLYNGYFKALRAFAANRAEWGLPEYFETRLPIIVPGALVYGALPDGLARYVLNVCILHGTIALSFWSVVRTFLSRSAATAATALLVVDIFYLRTIGWDYIDNAVLAYQALTFALLTFSGDGARSRMYLALAGFTTFSMLTVNVGSALWLPVFAVYRLYVVKAVTSRADVARELRSLVGWGAVGGIACLLIYGTISSVVLNGPFVYWIEQLKGGRNIKPAEYSVALGAAALGAYYLTIHAAALVASVGALVLWRFRVDEKPSRFASFCVWAIAIIYTLLIVGEGLKRTFFLARGGVYASHFLVLSYLGIAVLLFDSRRTRAKPAFPILLLLPGAAIVKLALHDGLGTGFWFAMPMILLAAALSVATLLVVALRRTGAVVVAVVVFALVSLAVPWPFERDDAIIETRNYILTGGAPPRVFYSESDPQRLLFVSIASALTDHVVHDHYRGPSAAPLKRGDRIAVLDSRLASGSTEEPCAIEGLQPTGFRRIPHRYLEIAVHLFQVSGDVRREDVSCQAPPESGPRFAQKHAYAAADLGHDIGELRDGALTGSEGRTSGGRFAFTPGLAIAAGTYRVTFRYATVNRPGAAQRWEISAFDGPTYHLVAGAEFPDTHGQPATLTVPFTIGASTEFGARAYFVGAGELSIFGIDIDEAVPD